MQAKPRPLGSAPRASQSHALPEKPRNYLRPLAEIQEDLYKEYAVFVRHFTKGGRQIPFLPWEGVAKILDWCAPGWEGRPFGPVTEIDGMVVVGYEITIHAQEGTFSRASYGREDLDKQGFGDSIANAERNAFKRAAGLWGVGRWLQDD